MTKNEVIKSNPELTSIADNLDRVSAIAAISEMEGGKLLINGLVQDIIGGVETVAALHKTMTLQEFISLGAAIKERMDLVKALTVANKNKEYLTELLDKELKALE